MNHREFMAWLLPSTMAALVIVLSFFGVRSLDELSGIRKEVTDLNLKMVQIVGNQNFFEQRLGVESIRINDLEIRVRKLEK